MSSQLIADHSERQAALDTTRSFIVQAPAGSGKTELLTQRFLALLARVERPQQVLAITFTRKAAAEMRNRLLDALLAARGERPVEAHRLKTWELARAVLAQDAGQNWSLCDNPAQLSIQTIDSFNSSLVRKMPWLSRFGGLPQLAEDARPLYRKAVEQLMLRLGSGQDGDAQLRQLLQHLDNRVARLQQMLVDMLARRDQWLRHVHQSPTEDPCAPLDASLGRLIELTLERLASATPHHLKEEVLACGRRAAQNLSASERPLLYLTDLDWWPDTQADHLPVWQGVADLLLTTQGELRRSRGINAACGFPAAERDTNQRMKQLVEELERHPDFVRLLSECRNLPSAGYLPEQRRVLRALVELLPLLVAELWLEFRRSAETDFAETALTAKSALGSADDPGELLLRVDAALEHILVDEFQDTSQLQHDLLALLTAGWQPGDGRTLFLVGDPMQSIYLFREAEVGLFLQTFGGRLGATGPALEPLRLSSNFRSQPGLVDWVNHVFRQVFPARVDPATGAVPHAPGTAFRAPVKAPAVTWQLFDSLDEEAEATAVVERIRKIRRTQPEASCAILVRGRTHLRAILGRLREVGLRYQAQDIDPLATRPAAQDLVSLYRALACRADRLSWLAVLRAPWCGLSLNDLECLVRTAGKRTIAECLAEGTEVAGCSPDGMRRLQRCWPLLERALSQRGRMPLRQLLESCWLSLGGRACYDAQGYQDAQRVLDMLETMQSGPELSNPEQLEPALERLFAMPDSRADGKLQVMTIHKAKGLEFDHVLLPGLGRIPARNDSPLLRWLEHPQAGLLLAPIAARDGSEQDRIYRMIGRLEQQKQDHEAARLLYVAVTRAKYQLHLFGHLRENSKGELVPTANSLLEKLWPVCAAECAEVTRGTGEGAGPWVPPTLKRLAVDWCPPPLPSSPVEVAEPRVQTASAASEDGRQDLLFSGWEEQTGRHVGTLVHALLEQLTHRGVEWWQQMAETQREKLLRQRLASLGVAHSHLDEALQNVQSAIGRMLDSQQGRWILQPHLDAVCELELSGLLEGRLIHAVVDRTFVTANRVRWVIDYKTSSPRAGESREGFVTRELAHYRPQLAAYASLVRAHFGQNVIRAALYFPMIDVLAEVKDVV